MPRQEKGQSAESISLSATPLLLLGGGQAAGDGVLVCPTAGSEFTVRDKESKTCELAQIVPEAIRRSGASAFRQAEGQMDI